MIGTNSERGRKNLSDNSRGVACLELAMCLGPLMFFLVAASDVARAANLYINLSRVTYEAVRVASRAMSLPLGTTSFSCGAVYPADSLQNLVCQVATKNDVINPSFVVDLSASVAPTTGTSAVNRRIVKITLSSPFTPDLAVCGVSFVNTLTSSCSGPYLFPLGS